MIRKLPKRKVLSIVILLLSISCYIGVKIPPQVFWPASVLGYVIPLMIIINIVLVVLYAFMRNPLFWFHLGSLVFLSPFIMMSYRVGNTTSSDPENTFEVLSLNAKLFRKPGSYQEFSKEMIQWFLNEPSDIKCIQEFSYNPEFRGLDLINKMRSKGYHYFNYEIDRTHHPGLATFSRHPIVNSGVINGKDSTNVNKCIYTDILIHSDTIRIYNVHLQSMNIDLAEYQEMGSLGKKIIVLTNKLGLGARRRSTQIAELIDHSGKSPHPVIICGDFNEIPYSYNYFQMKKFYENAFEERGEGFGITFNSSILPIRIDHHFYGKSVQLVRFNTDQNVRWSDHFPLQGVYSLGDTNGL